MRRLTQACRKIGLLHHVGGGNLGDDATLDAVAGNIKERWPNAEIVAFSMNPDDTEARHGLVSYPLRRKGWSIGYTSARKEATLKAAVKALTKRYGAIFYLLKSVQFVICLPSEVLRELWFLLSARRNVRALDLFVICGGGQLTEKDGSWGFPYTIFKWVMLAKAAGVRCVFVNLGAGPLNQTLSKFFVRRSLLAADYVSLRDGKSKVLVSEIGYTGESRVFPDSAYGFKVALVNTGPFDKKRTHPIVGFAPMPYPDPLPGGHSPEKHQIAYDEFIGKLATFASWLVGQSYALRFLGTDVGVDPLAIEHLQVALLKQHGIPSPPCSINRSIKSAHDVLAAMSRVDYVVTCRFHGVVFAHLANKPVLAIAHHPKVMELMTELGLSKYCVDIRDFDLKSLTERFRLLVTNEEIIKSCMAAQLTRNRRRLKSQFDELFRGETESAEHGGLHQLQ
jgi:polysaccharide pyruvyl transferase WcaK-like protein